MHTNSHFARDNSLQQLFRLIDLFFLILSFYLAILFANTQLTSHLITLASVSIVSFYLFAEALGLYRFEIYHIFKASLKSITINWALTFLFLLVAGYILNISDLYPREMIGSWFLITPFFLVAWRFILCKAQLLYFKDQTTQRNFAIIGANTIGSHIAETIINDLALGYHFLGFYDDRKEDDDRIIHNLKNYTYLGSFDEAISDAKLGKVDVLYIVLPMAAEYRIAKLLDELGDATTEVHIIPNFFVYNLLHSRWHNVGSYLALSIYDTPFYGVGSIIKRIEDLILGSLILLIITVPMLIIALIVKLSSPGPVIFKQPRYGLSGQKVIVWKFRSMFVCDNDDDDIKQATKNDSRITPFGSFMRKTSLDELPQFINVLQGSMSIVGPRPHAVAHNEMYRKEIDGYMLRHMVKPGITGLAQINGLRGETKELHQMKERVGYDLRYIRSWSLILDLKIIFMTIFKGFINKNAY
ncbi:MAG: undecaprenyl-phosphate glucose phosphotransferase [Pseudomonadota bacterium]